jgi:hypothetical protein
MGDLVTSLMNIYGSVREEFETYADDEHLVAGRLRNYSQYRKVRLYGFELAFPLIASAGSLLLAFT